jgi:O-6-methylguanine DNA methyltransferase
MTSEVLNTLQHTSFGEVMTYQQLASHIGRPKAVRAVGSALHRNPLPLLIPCHRIVSKKDGLGGFAYLLEIKEILLNFEKS